MAKQLPFDVGRYTIRLCQQSGGKAGKGYNKTSTVQVFFKRYYTVVKSFVYRVGDFGSFSNAVDKAISYAKKETEKANLPF